MILTNSKKFRLPSFHFKFLHIFFAIFFVSIPLFSQTIEQKKLGLILGSFYGDAFSGPYEFQKHVSKSFTLNKYTKKASAFSTFINYAPAGTITDDSRHKLIVLKALKNYGTNLSSYNIASQYSLEYSRVDKFSKIRRTWLSQFAALSHNKLRSIGVHKIGLSSFFSGYPTLLGHLIFTPLAMIKFNHQKETYKKCMQLNYFDQAIARDPHCMIISALNCLIYMKQKPSLKSFLYFLQTIDPLSLKKVQYTGRPLQEWILTALRIAKKKSSTKAFIRELKNNTQSKFDWDARTTFITSIAVLYRNRQNPMNSFKMINLIGRDSDSYSQLIGSIIGAIYGVQYFPKSQIQLIKQRLKEQYKIDIQQFIF